MSTYFYSNVIWLESGYKMSPLAYGPYTAVMDNGPAANEGDLLRGIVKWSGAA